MALDLGPSQIGKRLKEGREATGLTQAEAAAIVGVDPMTLSRWERGVQRPPFAGISLLFQRYGLSIEDLVEVIDEVEPTRRSDEWEPSPALRGVLPLRAYDVAIGYCRRLSAAGVPASEVEEAERLLIDPAYAKLNRRAKRELSEDEQIQIIDATWGIMQEVLSWKGVRA